MWPNRCGRYLVIRRGGGEGEGRMNVEHRTSNVELRMKKQKYDKVCAVVINGDLPAKPSRVFNRQPGHCLKVLGNV